MRIALTRDVSPSLVDCQLTHVTRAPIDVDRARAQHAAYEATLASMGCEIVHAPAAPELPDAVFVEDTAVVLDEVAIVARPGATTRRPEVGGGAETLVTYRTLLFIEEPGTLDGGDVLVMGRRLFVGRSLRTNDAAIDQRSMSSFTLWSTPVTSAPFNLASCTAQVPMLPPAPTIKTFCPR